MWHALPPELISKIISYTYKPQSVELLTDVYTYVNWKHLINAHYYNYWIEQFGAAFQEDRNWLHNDLCFFFNNYCLGIYGRTDDYLLRFRRMFTLSSYSSYQLNRVIDNLDEQDVEQQINIYWGLLTVDERILFFERHCS